MLDEQDFGERALIHEQVLSEEREFWWMIAISDNYDREMVMVTSYVTITSHISRQDECITY